MSSDKNLSFFSKVLDGPDYENYDPKDCKTKTSSDGDKLVFVGKYYLRSTIIVPSNINVVDSSMAKVIIHRDSESSNYSVNDLFPLMSKLVVFESILINGGVSTPTVRSYRRSKNEAYKEVEAEGFRHPFLLYNAEVRGLEDIKRVLKDFDINKRLGGLDSNLIRKIEREGRSLVNKLWEIEGKERNLREEESRGDSE